MHAETNTKAAVLEQLRKQILTIEGNRQIGDSDLVPIGLGEIESAFPGRVFQQGAVHELISASAGDAACTNGFIAVILGKLMHQGGTCLWVGARRDVFPPALTAFGVDPERVIFVDTTKAKMTLWALEEALKCEALTAVVGEITELSFNESRRLQLAVESSRVTGFVHRYRPRAENAVACVSRWKIRSLESEVEGAKPGVGFPKWHVQLLKVRSGKLGDWKVRWLPQIQGFEYTGRKSTVTPAIERKAG